ncbi:T6SS immunity protein Tli4 family protein [Pseudomonas mucidolens]|uniref:T6SS immunity protein Tli4 family protein n=1 Tax=Pseudomonas mucidolens TaxID=46679 RepID=UPI0030DB4B73
MACDFMFSIDSVRHTKTRTSLRGLFLLSACLVFALLTGCAAFKQPSQQEKQNVSEMTTHMRTWALGRGLIDLPANWDGSGNVTLYYGLDADHSTVEVRVLGKGVTQVRFDAAVDERIGRIASVNNYNFSDVPMLVSAKRETQQHKLLQYYESTELPDVFVHESHLLIDDAYVMLRAVSSNGNTAPVEARLLKLSKEIFKVAPEHAGAGFALGPIVIRSHHDQEIATFYFRPPASDVSLEVYVNALSPGESEPLLVRTKETTKIFLADDYDKLRAGATNIASMRADEFLIGFSNDTHRQLLFLAENYRETRSLNSPFMSFSLSAGGIKRRPKKPDLEVDLVRWSLPDFANIGYKLPRWQKPATPPPVNPSLTDYEAMAVWDAILKSVRLRFNSVAPKTDPYANFRWYSPEKAAENKRILDEFIATGPGGEPWKAEE